MYKIGFIVTLVMIIGISWSLALYMLWFWLTKWVDDVWVGLGICGSEKEWRKCFAVRWLGGVESLGAFVLYILLFPLAGICIAEVWPVTIPIILLVSGTIGIAHHLRHNRRLEKQVNKLVGSPCSTVK